MHKQLRGTKSAFAVLTFILCAFSLPASHAQCSPDGDVAFVCGPVSPEDLVHLPGTDWVLVSSWIADGYLSAANARSRETLRLFPVPGARSRHDASRFGQCPDMVTEGFHPHGMTLRPGDNGQHTLYVVRHGAREAIEVFAVDTESGRPQLTWLGCVVAPETVNMNSVVALPDSGFGVTSPATRDLWEWRPQAGWSRVPGSADIGPNGLEVTADGAWYYVAAYSDQAVVRLSRGETPPRKEPVAHLGFNIDNIHWSPDGALLAAGHRAPTGRRIGECITGVSCEGITSHVARVDVETGEWEALFNYPSNDNLRVGTVAIQVDEEIWVGSVAGSRRIAVIPVPD